MLCHSSNNAARTPSVRGQVSTAREFDRWKCWDSFHGPPASQAPRIAEDYRGHIPVQSPAWEREDLGGSEGWGQGEVVEVIILMKLLEIRVFPLSRKSVHSYLYC